MESTFDVLAQNPAVSNTVVLATGSVHVDLTKLLPTIASKRVVEHAPEKQKQVTAEFDPKIEDVEYIKLIVDLRRDNVVVFAHLPRKDSKIPVIGKEATTIIKTPWAYLVEEEYNIKTLRREKIVKKVILSFGT